MKNVLFACASLFLLALAFHLGATGAQSQSAQLTGQYVAVSMEVANTFGGAVPIGVIVTGSGQVFEYNSGQITYAGNLNTVPTSSAEAK